MAKLTVHEIQEAARALVLEHPGGIRYSEIHRGIATAHPETPLNTIHGAIQRLELRFADQIERPERGVYRPVEGTKTAAAKKPSVGASTPAASPPLFA